MDTTAKKSAFTLLEMLTVIAVIGILAAIVVPTLHTYKPNPLASASRQMLDDLAYARHRAIADHSTVYVVFIPPTDNMPGGFPGTLTADDQQRFLKGQCISYGFFESREIGAQPGVLSPHYLKSRHTLPQGTAIPIEKFGIGTPPPMPAALISIMPTNFYAFDYSTNGIVSFNPDAAPATGAGSFPYIAFDYNGSLAADRDAVIPLTRATINLQGGPGNYTWVSPGFQEQNPGDWTNFWYHVVIDQPTGRARVERFEVQ